MLCMQVIKIQIIETILIPISGLKMHHCETENISLTYNIPKKITKVADIQLSVSAQNLFTLTKYTGMDPEVYSESDYGFNGVDMGSYPVPRTFTFGMKLNF